MNKLQFLMSRSEQVLPDNPVKGFQVLRGSYESSLILGHSAVQPVCEPTFRRNISPSSRSKIRDVSYVLSFPPPESKIRHGINQREAV
jgi:hypothetical protein